MLEAIRTVFGAVATKDIVPILTHILIYNGRMQAGDGCVTIDCNFPSDIKPCAVPGQKLLQAVKGCGDEPGLSFTEGGKLAVKKGKFKAYLSVLPMEDFPVEKPDADRNKAPDDFIKVVQDLRPFVSKDASRPWSMGILLKDGFAYATNNIILVRQRIDWSGRDVIIPLRALDDLITMKENPLAIAGTDDSVTFFYRDSTWLKTQVLLSPWPDLAKILGSAKQPEDYVPPGFLDDVMKVKAFCSNVKFPQITIGETVESDDGGDKAIVDGYNFPKGVFHADHLTLVLQSATKIDFSNFPAPCSFSNERGLFGVFVGVKS